VKQTKFYVIKDTTPDIRWNQLNGAQGFDGVLGLAPMNWKTHDFLTAESNFVNKLSGDNYVGQPVFSLYISLKKGNSSHIKFGGWDRAATMNKRDPIMLRAVKKDSYELNFGNVLFSQKEIFDTMEANVLFDPGSKYIHVPEKDFNNMRNTINQRVRERLKAAKFDFGDNPNYDACSKNVLGQTDTYCKLPGTCHYMEDVGLNLEFQLTIKDSQNASKDFTIDLSGRDMLVDGTDIFQNQGKSCFLPIMKQEFIGS
jgi:hypothetical protein